MNPTRLADDVYQSIVLRHQEALLQDIKDHERIIDLAVVISKPIKAFEIPENIRTSYTENELEVTQADRARGIAVMDNIRKIAIEKYDPAVMEEIHRKNYEDLEEALKAEEQRNEAGRNGNS
jgi:hypothetical protein